MTTVTENIRFKARGGTAAALAMLNEIPLARELVLETDTGKIKFGNGSTAWNSLAYFDGSNAETIRDVIGAALVAGTGITIAVNDAADTITLAIDGAVIDERARDAIGATLVGGLGVRIVPNDGADTITVSAGAVLNAYAGDSGEYLLNAINSTGLTTIATAASRFEFYPLIPLAQDITISAIAIYVTTGVASALSRVGIYADNNGKPDGGALICDSGALDCATSSTAREGAVSVALTKGTRYWLCILSNNTQTLRAINLAATMALPMVTDLSGTSIRNVRRASLTYGALPATAPTTSNSASTHIAIGLKYA